MGEGKNQEGEWGIMGKKVNPKAAAVSRSGIALARRRFSVSHVSVFHCFSVSAVSLSVHTSTCKTRIGFEFSSRQLSVATKYNNNFFLPS